MNRKKIVRGMLGFPIGVWIGYMITILASVIWADGYYMPCVPELISVMGNEINAVILQTFLSGLLGTGFAVSSFIWEIENWNIVKQTGIYFFVISFIMMPVAYATYWMEHSILGFLQYFGIFILIFVFVWIIQFIIAKHNVKKLNENLCSAKNKIEK